MALGVLSGLLGGWPDRVIMMVVDFQLSIPFLLIVLVGIAIFGTSIPVLLALVGLAYWETYARLSRGQVLSVRENPFIEAAMALGATNWRIALRHVLPNIASPMIVLLTINFPAVLLLESSLSFLGIGVQPPTASLGRMVGEGRDYMISAWWLVISPGGFIVLETLQVPIDQIVGSLGSYRDFDRAFLPRQKRTKDRWVSIDKAKYEDIELPPIELYKIGEVYFVKDGNHRVSVARERGQEFVDARVVEIEVSVPLTSDTRISDLDLKQEYAQFVEKTGIFAIRPQAKTELTLPGEYDGIMEQINVHRWHLGQQRHAEIPFSEAVASWYDNVYTPLV